jgi:xyloglucan-specific endo-beta-1,4-glucanase
MLTLALSLNTDLWGESDASSGSQCVHLVSLTGSTVAFGTNWTWTGGTSVKSYANIQLNQGINKVLSTISTIPVCNPAFPLDSFLHDDLV